MKLIEWILIAALLLVLGLMLDNAMNSPLKPSDEVEVYEFPVEKSGD